jgi:predicted lactoylglutathione lyase
MSKQLLINLPVRNRKASVSFFEALGLPLNEKLSDEQATCFNLEGNIVVVLLPIEHFKETINGNSVADQTTNEALLAIGMESRGDVDDLLDKATAAGGQELHERVDMPEIYAGTFKDLDGHLWNVFHMR